MRHKNGRWWDDSGNSWDDDLFTEAEAVEMAKTLVNCDNCRNCSNLSNCRYCRDCSYSSNLSSCRDCSYSSDLSSCRNCSYCRDCRDLSNCSDCRNCRDLSNCSYCRYCRDLSENPQRLTSGKIGSRNSQTTIYWWEDKTWVVCGCFKGSIEEFRKAVEKTHGDNEHGLAYRAFISRFEAIMAMK